MDTGNGKQTVSDAASSTSSPTSPTFRRGGSASGSGGNGNGEQQVVVGVGVGVRRNELDSLILSLSPPVVTDDLNDVPPPPPPAPVPAPPPAPIRAAGRRNQPREPNVPPPYPWATNQRATVHSLEYLLNRGIYTISGEVSCKKCKSNFTIEFDLLSKFDEIKQYIICFRGGMHDRAPPLWTNPELPTCRSCGFPSALRPTFGKKRTINWLFLLLSQMLGCCSINQLKYFCKHTNNHRTGAKDRLVFLTYLGVCKQLQDIRAFHYPDLD